MTAVDKTKQKIIAIMCQAAHSDTRPEIFPGWQHGVGNHYTQKL